MEVADEEPRTLISQRSYPSVEALQCPYPYYAALRAEAPIYKVPDRNEYIVSHHEDIQYVARHPEIFSNHHSILDDGWMRAATLEDAADEGYAWGVVLSDPPEHTAVRKIAFEMFKPGRLRGHESMIRAVVDDLIDAFVDRGHVELVSEFATLLPARVILTLFGLPLEDAGRALSWARYDGNATRYHSYERHAASRQGIMDMGAYLADSIRDRQKQPRDDDLSRLVEAYVAHYGELDLRRIVASASNLLTGGIITTAHLLGSMMRLLLDHPDQMASVRADHGLLKRTVEETLRMESPVQFGPRLVLADTELRGQSLPAGSIVLLLWASANRDECVFAEPERFDIDRANATDHLAFASGPHFCLGAPLARLETRVAFEQLLARVDNIRFAPGRNDFRNHDSAMTRGLSELYLEFDQTGHGNHRS